LFIIKYNLHLYIKIFKLIYTQNNLILKLFIKLYKNLKIQLYKDTFLFFSRKGFINPFFKVYMCLFKLQILLKINKLNLKNY